MKFFLDALMFSEVEDCPQEDSTGTFGSGQEKVDDGYPQVVPASFSMEWRSGLGIFDLVQVLVDEVSTK